MNGIITDTKEYFEWVKSLSSQFRKSQIKAASKVNQEMLKFYWNLGKDISEKEFTNTYGSAFFKKLSKDLQEELPDVKSFSVTNLHYMKKFYELYSSLEKFPQAGGDSLNLVFTIPWGHNKLIIDKCKNNTTKALYYVEKTLENNWSRAVLLNFLETDLYERQGHAITNFEKLFPDIGSDLAMEMTKDPYNFDFLTLKEGYNEKELKDALMDNVQKFLMELGRGFAFGGRECRVVVGNTEQYIDLLFYSIKNHCYVVVEVKVNDFEPRDMGQLGTYVAIVDDVFRGENDGITVGLLICKTKDNVLAKYAVNAVNVPIGISEYELNEAILEDFNYSMPTIKEIEEELSEEV